MSKSQKISKRYPPSVKLSIKINCHNKKIYRHPTSQIQIPRLTQFFSSKRVVEIEIKDGTLTVKS